MPLKLIITFISFIIIYVTFYFDTLSVSGLLLSIVGGWGGAITYKRHVVVIRYTISIPSEIYSVHKKNINAYIF